MNEPVIANLYYNLKLSPELAFDNPAPLEEDLEDFSLRLNAGVLDITMKREIQTVKFARSIVEPYLRSWELDHFLKSGRKDFWFEYKNSLVIDKNPAQGGSKVMHAESGEFRITGYAPTLTITRRSYPIPDFTLSTCPDVESLLNRYEGFLNKNEPLLAMAYFCLTVIEAKGSDRASVAAKYKIDLKVLQKLGTLTSTRGDMKEARKAGESFEPLTAREIDWITAAIRSLIRRIAEYNHSRDKDYRLIDMHSLPDLS